MLGEFTPVKAVHEGVFTLVSLTSEAVLMLGHSMTYIVTREPKSNKAYILERGESHT